MSKKTAANMARQVQKKKAAAKKTILSDREYVDQLPNEDDIGTKDDGARYLPIEVVERDLDRWVWGTENFAWKEFRDKGGDFWIGASLELVIPWRENNRTTERRLVGCCNFSIGSYFPNSHFVATAKSECVKNAASDLGRKFGRGLNDNILINDDYTFKFPSPGPVALEKPKKKPDHLMQERIRKAKEEGDEAALAIYAKFYEIKPDENGDETI